MKQIAVIGAGGMGRFHAETLASLPGVRLAAIADPYPHPDLEVHAAAGTEITTDVTACAAAGWDGVVIASPDETHAELTLAALDAGSRVLCEKPLSHDLDGANAVIAKEAELGERRVQIGFMREVDSAHAALAAELPALGALQYLRCTHRNTNAEARPPATVLVQSLIHDIHTVRWLAGEVTEVDARAIPRPGGLAHVLLVLRLASGATATVEFSDDGPAYAVLVEATGTNGVLASRGAVEPPPRSERRATETASGAAAEPTERSESAIVGELDWFGWFADAYRIQDRAWVESLAAPAAAGPSAVDGLAAQLVAEAALTSIDTGRPVAVPAHDVPELYRR